MSIIASMIHSKYIIQVSDSRGTVYQDSSAYVNDKFKKVFQLGQNMGIAYAGVLMSNTRNIQDGVLMSNTKSIQHAVDIFNANMDLSLPIPQIAQVFYGHLRKYWPPEAKFVFHLGGYRDGEPYLLSGFWPGAEGDPPEEPVKSVQPGVLIINQHNIERVTLMGRDLPELYTLSYPDALGLIVDKVFEATLTAMDCGGRAQIQVITEDRVKQFFGEMRPPKQRPQK